MSKIAAVEQIWHDHFKAKFFKSIIYCSKIVAVEQMYSSKIVQYWRVDLGRLKIVAVEQVRHNKLRQKIYRSRVDQEKKTTKNKNKTKTKKKLKKILFGEDKVY